MRYAQLGVDEQAVSFIPFASLFSPTDLEEAAHQMAKILESNGHGGLVDRVLWLPFGKPQGVIKWLQKFILIARALKQDLSETTQGTFLNQFVSQGYNVKDCTLFINAYLQALSSGLLPLSIAKPLNYAMTTASQDVVKAITPLVLTAIVAYIAINSLVPNLIPKVSFNKP